MKPLLLALVAGFPSAALAQETPSPDQNETEEASQPQEQSKFVGRYDGNSFETAMGMIVREDGTFQWGLSVGGLDLRAKGTWQEINEAIVLKSEPKPVPPEFTWSAVEDAQDGPFLRIQWADSGEPFSFADVRGLCANGELILTPVMDGKWSPGDTCDKPETIELYLRSYQVLSGPFKLSGNRKVREGQTIVFDFHRNDLGVADFDGVMGQLVDGELRLESSLGNMTLRKLTPPTAE
ncbi:hypothetical protein [Erythrobacter longus]|uniref:hypothetical protein n=1 Tax=Erythrobacter longus TaxID=1044 RepID=UPI0019D70B61|nr:hypothetical protein [Erythrobacter longus]